MDKQSNSEKLVFKLFLDAVKRKDKMQFSYFDLYMSIKNSEKNLEKENLTNKLSEKNIEETNAL